MLDSPKLSAFFARVIKDIQKARTVIPWNVLCAVHPYNRAGNVELIDGAVVMPLKKLLSSRPG
jgi:hypothetical protein